MHTLIVSRIQGAVPFCPWQSDRRGERERERNRERERDQATEREKEIERERYRDKEREREIGKLWTAQTILHNIAAFSLSLFLCLSN